MTDNRVGKLNGKNVLLLQGPMGPFFRKLDHAFRKRGACTFRIAFNGGDYFFADKCNVTHFMGKPDHWRAFIGEFIHNNKIDNIFVYGDCRYYHRLAIDAAGKYGVEVFAFEEGYVRPDFITLEKGGVNAHSSMPKDPLFYHDPASISKAGFRDIAPVRYAFEKWSLYAVLYYVMMGLYRKRYVHYRHHRNPSVWREAAFGVRNFIRKLINTIAEKPMGLKIATNLRHRYYFVPLQTIGDFQISMHSQFTDMVQFIQTVILSFKKNAPENTLLLIKHHPLDRGRSDHTGYIRRIARAHGLSDRVVAIHDVHLPTCLKNAIGTITINSTVGLSSLYHGTPTIVLGKSFYDIQGLTCKGMSLDDFWRGHRAPDPVLFNNFKASLIDRTQLAGSFYSGFPEELIH